MTGVRFFLIGGLVCWLCIRFSYAGSLQSNQPAFDRKEYNIALLLWRALAEQGDARAQDTMGDIYAQGFQGGVPDKYEARKWYKRAAERGYSLAQWKLAQLIPDYEPEKKAPLYRLSAEQGFLQAQSSLATMYDRGVGVEQSFSESAKWYRRAADQGDYAAQQRLAEFYERGLGRPRDLVQAHFWYDLAITNFPLVRHSYSIYDRNELQNRRDAIARGLSPQQIASVQQDARQWLEALVSRTHRRPPGIYPKDRSGLPRPLPLFFICGTLFGDPRRAALLAEIQAQWSYDHIGSRTSPLDGRRSAP